MTEQATSDNGQYRIHDEPPVVTDDPEAVQAARDLGYDVTEINDE